MADKIENAAIEVTGANLRINVKLSADHIVGVDVALDDSAMSQMRDALSILNRLVNGQS